MTTLRQTHLQASSQHSQSMIPVLPVLPVLPALQWLGYGLDLTTLRPFDLEAILETVKRKNRIIDIEKDKTIYSVTIDGMNFPIPRCISVSQNINSQTDTRIYKNGAEAVNAMRQDVALASRFLAVTSTDVSNYPLDRWFPAADQFSLYYFHADNYLAGLQEYLDFLNESALREGVSRLPRPFTPDKEATVLAYKTFFNTYGSHVITNASYGARFLMNVWASNSHADVNENFNRDATAMVKGINDSWKYDQSVYQEIQYQTFNRLSQSWFTAYGGDPLLASALSTNQIDQDTFNKWSDSTTSNPDLVHIQTMPLWSLLQEADSKELRDRADDVQHAFQYLTSPQGKEFTTFFTFEVEATWAELGLLIPSTVVVGGDSVDVIPPSGMVLGPTKLRWETGSNNKTRFVSILTFTNDGTPIDFNITCEGGKAKVTIAGTEYVNDGGEGKTKWFYQVPVTKVAQTRGHSSMKIGT
ncbi:hypothetical protein K503DRAFT_801742 [Rhizopogon vinicolor AM-OR11-026]|uniref:MACPF domain-containing protein n=1 Tax=Rhizopogon vinicolor AM-OR11-026 TaxID=1314800 RepID=A0A1B7MW07_9AGAM|nr:hypothetical protein K503DRAFT_801742 [Rhizopogon vinicolor AM-OR11-026]